MEQELEIQTYRKCKSCNNIEYFHIPLAMNNICVKKNTEYIIDNKQLMKADVATFVNNKIICVFEIYDDHNVNIERENEREIINSFLIDINEIMNCKYLHTYLNLNV